VHGASGVFVPSAVVNASEHASLRKCLTIVVLFATLELQKRWELVTVNAQIASTAFGLTGKMQATAVLSVVILPVFVNGT